MATTSTIVLIGDAVSAAKPRPAFGGHVNVSQSPANICFTARTPRSHRAPVDRTDRRRHPAGARSSISRSPLRAARRSPASRRPAATTIVASCAPGVSPPTRGEASAFVRSRRELSFAPPSGLSSTADRSGSKRSNSKNGALRHGRNVAFVVEASRLHAQPGRPRHKARHAGVPDADPTSSPAVIPTERTKPPIFLSSRPSERSERAEGSQSNRCHDLKTFNGRKSPPEFARSSGCNVSIF